jgi:hypothetical protein
MRHHTVTDGDRLGTEADGAHPADALDAQCGRGTTLVRLLAALADGRADVGAVRVERGRDPVVKAGFTAAATWDEGEVAASLGEQVAAVEVPTVRHQEGVNQEGVNDVGASSEERPRAAGVDPMRRMRLLAVAGSVI